MTTKPSAAPWADEPFELIPTPSKRMDGSLSHVYCASEMAHSHNTLLRGLNAIVQQAPHVPDASAGSAGDGWNAQDVQDLLFYVQSWVKMVQHHHWVEESYIFPQIEAFTGQAGIMDDPRHQHELFHGGLEALLAFASGTRPEDYRWEGEGGMKAVVDSFSKELVGHLYAEIDVFLGMADVEGDGLRQTWDKAEAIAKQTGNIAMLYDVFPIVLGCSDKTYEGDNQFPPLPSVVPYAIKYWFALGNGAWRFNPCDWWGRPRPLSFGPACSGTSS